MRKVAVAALAVALISACGGGGGGDSSDNSPAIVDNSPAFVGTWQGSSVVVLDGESVNSPGAYTRIVRTGTNAIVVNDVCGDGSGPAATVTSESSFKTVAINCPAVAVEGCSSVSFVVNGGGTGSLTNGQLRMTISGALTGCGYTYPVSLTFTGTRAATSVPAALVADGTTTEVDAARVTGNIAPALANLRF